MKKKIYSIGVLFLFSGITLYTGCKKDDTTPPVVTLKGNASENSVLNAAYSDPGATASDDEDGDISSSIVVSGSVNKDLKGSYTLTYTATDAAGNVGTATRTVAVKNDAEPWAGSYTITDTNPAISGSYNGTISTSSTVNNKIIINNLGKYGVDVQAVIAGTKVTIASQTITSSAISGTPDTGPIYTTADGSLSGSTTMAIPYRWDYQTGSYDAGTATLVKQ